MKNTFTHLLIILLFVLAESRGFAQVVVPANTMVCSGSSALLTLTGSPTDTIQWQSSVDNITWMDLMTPSDTTYNTANTTVNTIYRAKITYLGSTIYSNSAYVAIASTPIIVFSNYTGTSITVNWIPGPGGGANLSWTGAGIGSLSNCTPPMILTGLIPNTPLTVTVSLSIFCAGVTAGVSTFTPACPYTISAQHIDATCGNSNGSINLFVNPLSTLYTYNWSTGDTIQDLSNLAAGIYNVTVADSSNCLQLLSVTVNNINGPVVAAINQNSSCQAGNASSDITVSGGAPPYTYLWNNGATDEDLINITAGVYTITVTDQNGCEGFNTITIVDSSLYYYVYFNPVYPNCVNNGAITATVYSGNPPYSYLWSNGQTTQTASNLAGGQYSVTVTDNTGCQLAVSNFYLYSSCYNIIKGNIYNDINGNCIKDAGENSMSGIIVSAFNGTQTFYGYSNSVGDYSINCNVSGTYAISANMNYYGYGSCASVSTCVLGNVVFSSLGDTSFNNDFGFNGNAGYDLRVFSSWAGANPGFTTSYYIYPYDLSFVQYAGNSTVTFYYDSQLVYDYSLAPQPVHDSIAHTLTWTVNNLPNYFSWNNHLSSFFTVPVGTPNNYQVESDFYITPTSGDCDTSNNHLHTSSVVTGSLDPNAKEVSPAGNILNTDSVLTYTIHFQNTGNDTTHFVIVTDTLPSSLDPTTVVNLASSAPFSDFSISGTGVLKWVFNPLFLPDSATNEPASKGFVMFKIKVKPNLPFGTTINNKASIFFDYNPAVITNYATNSIVNGIEQLTVNSEQLIVYPNPATDEVIINSPLSIINYVVVTDVLGREIYSQQANAQSSTINCQLYAAGIYFVKVQLGNGNVVVKRFVKE